MSLRVGREIMEDLGRMNKSRVVNLMTDYNKKE